MRPGFVQIQLGLASLKSKVHSKKIFFLAHLRLVNGQGSEGLKASVASKAQCFAWRLMLH